MRRLRIVLVWAFAAAVTLVGAWRLEIGPTLWAFNERHGIHAGDLVMAGACGLVAAVVSRRWS